MRRLAVLILFLAWPAFAQVSPSNMPAATLPLDGTEAVLLDQGAGCATHVAPCTTSQAPSARIGQPAQQTTAPSAPFQYQYWWDTSLSPNVLKLYTGGTWVSLIQVDTVNGVWSFPDGIYLPSGFIGLGTTTVAPNWPITMFENNTSIGPMGETINAYENSTGIVGTAWRGFAARGTLAAPLSVQANDVLAGMIGSGYWSGKTNAYFDGGDARAGIQFKAGENWAAATNNGSYIEFLTTQNATSTMREVGRISDAGNLGIGTTNPTFGLTLSKNNIAGQTSQGYTLNTYENATGLVGGGFRSFAARGTSSAPTALVTNDPLLILSGSGFWTGKANGFWSTVDGRAQIGFYAGENWSGSANNGAYIAFSTTTNATSVLTERMRLQASGGLSLGTMTDPGLNNMLIAGTLGVGITTAPQGLLEMGGSDIDRLLYLSRPNNVAGTAVSQSFRLYNSNNAYSEYARIGGHVVTNTAGAEEGSITLSTTRAGLLGTATLTCRSGGCVLSDGGSFQTNTPPTDGLWLKGPLQLTPVTVVSLGACNAGAKGQIKAVSDANAPTYNTNVAGGGAVSIPVYCDGTNWKAH